MFIKRFLGLFAIIFTLSGCMRTAPDWHGEYGATTSAGTPTQIPSGLYYGEYDMDMTTNGAHITSPANMKNVSVLLPLSGPNSQIGRGIEQSVQMAFVKKRYNNISVTFHDLVGNRNEKQEIITNVLGTNPDVIIGPVFAADVAHLRDVKPADLPVLTFSSDTTALGNGVMTMALIPSQSIEAIIAEMSRDGVTNMIIVAPQTQSGERMAGAATLAADMYNIPLNGLFYYTDGNTDSIKQTAARAAMHTARAAANTRAREILSDILIRENITAEQRANITAQLEKISKSDTLGRVPYDAILFLGGATDTKTMVSFLRYYDVSPRDARLYGTAVWDASELLRDYGMVGAKFAALPPISETFSTVYERISGTRPSRLDTFGYDAANLVIGMLHSGRPYAAYLLDPSGYNGLDGLFRLRPNGLNERALEIVELNGGGTTRLNKPAARNFLTPIYNIDTRRISRASEMDLVAPGIDPMDYITIPKGLRGKYRTKPFGTNTRTALRTEPVGDTVVIMPEDDTEIFESEEFKPITLEPINRTLIDSVEIKE